MLRTDVLFKLDMANPAFEAINSRFEARGVRTWSTHQERALLFQLALQDHVRTIVEIGSFCGGSASFLGEAMRLRNNPRSVFCVDPFIGGPVWFPRGYMHSTFDEFTKNIDHLGLTDYIVPMRGESAEIAAIWPARPIDLLFIDGDHSLLGAISDFEKWAPKVKKGGMILIDDIDHIQDVAKFINIIASIHGLHDMGKLGGIAIFKKNVDSECLMEQLTIKLNELGIRRPWNYAPLSEVRNPQWFVHHVWPLGNMKEWYELVYFSIAPHGDYGVTPSISENLRGLAVKVADDKKDGRVIDITTYSATALRVILCKLDELINYVSFLQPGTVVLVEPSAHPDDFYRAGSLFARLGVEGLGHEESGLVYWGVFNPFALSRDVIITSHFRNARLE